MARGSKFRKVAAVGSAAAEGAPIFGTLVALVLVVVGLIYAYKYLADSFVGRAASDAKSWFWGIGFGKGSVLATVLEQISKGQFVFAGQVLGGYARSSWNHISHGKDLGTADWQIDGGVNV